MGTTMKKKMALKDGESKTQGCQRFSFIPTPLWSNTAASRVARDGFNFFGVTGHSG
jgi:hypothetical protein